MTEFSNVVMFFNTLKFKILGEVFTEIENFAQKNDLSFGYYKDDRFLNSLYLILPQEERVVLILCPQGGSRYHCLHFSKERFEKFKLALNDS